ncbi:hypothetical protein RRG08_035872 [Elysia crispata]|uniref:DNA polymerase delta subunit 3 n=1 Tax=Elysia crispata TaxID=231223 RepID=A0AAE1B217_9GAST|nr:hypothetical protein RRG08_035872 [Elysia crispata]
MACETDKALLQENIEEYIKDDNKVVTCKWLSLMHSIDINVAKRALHIFVHHQRNKGGNDDINVTFFVAGLGKSKDGDLMHKCAVVPETELEVVKRSLATVTSCHIFSVQKAKLKDYTPLYMTDYEVIKDNIDKCNRFSSIKCPWVSLKSGLSASKSAQQDVVKSENKGHAFSNKTETGNDSPGSKTRALAKKVEPKGSITSMFASASKKDGGGNESSKPVQKTDAASKIKATKKKGGVTAFFEKKGDSPLKQKDVLLGKDSKKMDASSERFESNVTNEKKQDPKRKKKQAADADEEAPDKKRRRRIKTDLFDSSDDEDVEAGEPEEPEEEIEEMEQFEVLDKGIEEEHKMTEEEQKEEVDDSSLTKSAVVGKKRKRTKKVVSKHYEDEEGFMVTKKETVWESETDEEDEASVNKQEKKSHQSNTSEDMGKLATKNTKAKADPKGKAAAKKNSSPQKSKQTSLMSFFKKK